MAKYRVVLKGLKDKSEAGRQAFLDRFGKAYNMTPEKAQERIKKSGGALYHFADEAGAEKARKFLESIGAVAVVEADEPAAAKPSAPPPIQAPPPIEGPPSIDDSGRGQAAFGGVRACPKCGYQVPVKEDECPSCHVFISKYEQMQARKAQAAAAQAAAVPAVAASPGGTMYAGPAPQPRPGTLYQGPMPQAAAIGPSSAKVTCPDAKTALIAAIVGLFCFGFALGAYAVVKGISALDQIKRNPEYSGTVMAYIGIFLGILDFIGWVAGLILRFQ
jgi:ssDNA-binding Zn-finger/Zn-ribbon topoisomerase 1